MIGIAFLFIRGQLFRFMSWLLASSTNLLIAGCVILACWGAWEHLQADKWHTEAIKHLNALRAAESAKQAAEAKSQTLAKDNTDAHKTRLTGDLAAGRRYVAAHRVQACTAPGRSGEGINPGVPVEAPELRIMAAVSDSDIDACTRNYDQALGAADYLNGLISAGLGEVGK